MSDKPGTQWRTNEEWSGELEALDLEIANLALLCKARLLELPVLERVLDNDMTVCGVENPEAFNKLRGLLFLHFDVEKKLAEGSGAAEARHVVAAVHRHLMARLGKHLAELD